MKLFLLNVFLALIWALLQGTLRTENVAIGFVLINAFLDVIYSALDPRIRVNA